MIAPLYMYHIISYGPHICGSSSVVEHYLAKVGVAGSSPVFRSLDIIECCRGGGIGRRTGLKILRGVDPRTGSIPVLGI